MCGAPRGKWGPLYGSTLFAFAVWLYFFYIRPAMLELVIAQNHMILDPQTLLLFNIAGIICIVLGSIILFVVGYGEYKKWRSAHK